GLLARQQGRDELHQRQQRDRAEEVHADHPLGAARRPGQADDRDGGGVGGQDHPRIFDDLVERAEHVQLQRLVLRHRLEHELPVGQLLQVRGERDARQRLVPLLLADRALAHALAQRAGQPAQAALAPAGRPDGPPAAEARAAAAGGDAGSPSLIAPLRTPWPSERASRARPRSPEPGVWTATRTSRPARAQMSAMPAPMSPHPTTPILLGWFIVPPPVPPTAAGPPRSPSRRRTRPAAPGPPAAASRSGSPRPASPPPRRRPRSRTGRPYGACARRPAPHARPAPPPGRRWPGAG